MANIEISRDVNGISLEANYFMSGVIAILLGGAMFIPSLMDLKINTQKMVKT
jgi:hypothetical protein